MNSVAPVWDGNETWLVLGGGGLFAVFPLAYAVIMPALYAPIIVMLLGLVFRGVAFEFRCKTKRGKFLWDWAFFGGIAGRGTRARHCARRLRAGHSGRGPRLCRRLVGLADALQRVHRHGAGRAAMRLLGATWLILKPRALRRRRPITSPGRSALRHARLHRPRSACGRRFSSRSTWSAGSPGRRCSYVAPVPLLVAIMAYLLLIRA